MELGWLEDLLALVAEGNFSRAASRRHVTQPAFSRRIRAFEAWVGAPLVERAARPVVPTAIGRLLLPEAADILRRLERIREHARQADGGAVLRLASTHALSFTFLPGWLRRIEIEEVQRRIHIHSDSLAACERLMVGGEAQFLLCHRAPGGLGPPDFRAIVVGRDRLLLVSGADPRHGPRLAYSGQSGLGRIVRAEAAQAAPSKASAQAAPTEASARAAPTEASAGADASFTSPLAAVLRQMVRDGRGTAWLPESLIGSDLADGTIRRTGDAAPIAVEICLVRPEATQDPHSERFWAHAARIAGDAVRSPSSRGTPDAA